VPLDVNKKRDCTMRNNYIMNLILISVLFTLTGCGSGISTKKVHTIRKPATEYIIPAITDKGKFLNDLMLSPYWKVERERNGIFRARARSISQDFDSFTETPSDKLLFSFIRNGESQIPKGYIISNRYMRGGDMYSTFTVDIIFQKFPKVKDVNIYEKRKPMVLDIFESYENKIGPNSYSTLSFKLSNDEDIYLLIREHGSDLNRKITFANIPEIMQEVERINKLSQSYYAKDSYKDFFRQRFKDLESEVSIKRTPGLQDRDTFYGYFKADKDINYNGINIKISHPVYCNGECIRPFSRIRKAEYLGKPHYKNDLLYFQIEDNAVYLVKREYDQKFGTFSGSGSFKGKLEIMNKEGKLLADGTDQFKGWER
jgi:hypothetical protein